MKPIFDILYQKAHLRVFWLLLSLAISAQLTAQVVSGRITDLTTGEALIGATVLEDGTRNGTVSDAEGNFTLTLTKPSAVLVVSYVGFGSQRIETTGGTVEIQMTEGSDLDEVVVTALGIARDKKSLSYAAQEVSSGELNRVKDANVINGLSGRTAGLQINRSASGVGGSTRVVMRGNKSTRDNNVLYVVDGIPMFNYSNAQPGDIWGQSNGSASLGRDAGDAISNLNAEDIESVTVLKGASAAALYGSQAANGVILITSKKGKEGQTRVDFNSNTTFETPTLLPELQYSFGQTKAGADDSWGPAANATDHVKDFFQTGQTYINSIGLTGGNKVAQTYFSYANTQSNGIIPTSEFKRHNLTLRENAQFFNNRLDLSASLNYINQRADNRPTSGLYFNPLTGLYLFPRGLDFAGDFGENNFEMLDDSLKRNVQNWTINSDVQQNPYWTLYRNPHTDTRNRIMGTVSVGLRLTDWATVQLRGNMDRTYDRFEQRIFSGGSATLSDANGRFILARSEGTQRYGDVLLNLNKSFELFSVAATLGSSITDVKRINQNFDSKGGSLDGVTQGLRYPNIFNIQNVLTSGSTFGETQPDRSQLQAVFGSLSLGYRNMLYLDVTGRNDWSSTLAFTDNISYFYPSVGATAIISEMADLGGLDFAKIRASYAEVGSGVNPYDTHPLNRITSSAFDPPTSGGLPGKEFVPERSKSIEVGADVRFWQSRAGIDVTWYKTNTINQRISVGAPPASGLRNFIVNAGDIQNSGIEATLNLVPFRRQNVEWLTNLNFTRNVNEVIELTPLLNNGTFELTDGGVNNYNMVIREGYPFGEISGKGFTYLNGAIVVDSAGAPIPGLGDTVLGNPAPDFILGWNNTVNVGAFSFGFLIDGRFGGEVMSITQAMLDQFGVSQATADARTAGGVTVDAVRGDGTPFNGPINAETYYKTTGGRAGITGAYIYDGTSIRLRELSIGYALPKSVMSRIGRGAGARIAFVARNLIYFRNDAPFDPDVSMSTATGLQGVDVFSQPAVRSYGLNLALTF